jgi:chromosome segregation ATPase
MMEAALNTLPSWAAAGGGAGAGFFLLKFILEWIGGRVDKREEANTASAARLDAATYKLIETLEKRMEDLTTRLDLVENELVHCRAQHAQCEAELTRLRAAVQGLGDARQQAANIVAAEKAMDRTVAAIVHKAGEAAK